MSYDLVVWEGERPATNRAALATYQDLCELHIDIDEVSPPTPGIRGYVDALLERWPDIDAEDSSPWSDGPLINNASGPIIYFGVVHGRAEEVSVFAAELAASRGLVCLDPQEERLRP